MRTILIVVAFLIPASVQAQQAQSPMEQSLLSELNTQVSSKLQCNAGLIAAQSKIKELEAKLAAAQPDPAPAPKPEPTKNP